MIDFGDIMRIGWAITGAGHLLNESVDALEELAENNEITVFLSNASEEVLKMYGLYERVEAITGGRYRELATDSNQKFSFPITGRLSLGKYDLLIVSPATANTVGLSFDYAAAALATVTATTRQSANVVGNSFKTLFF